MKKSSSSSADIQENDPLDPELGDVQIGRKFKQVLILFYWFGYTTVIYTYNLFL